MWGHSVSLSCSTEGHGALGLTLGCRHCERVAQVRARRIPGCDSPENRGTQRAGKSCDFWGFRVSFLFFSKKKKKIIKKNPFLGFFFFFLIKGWEHITGLLRQNGVLGAE